VGVVVLFEALVTIIFTVGIIGRNLKFGQGRSRVFVLGAVYIYR
jgi:hypothetical protein